MSKDQNQFEKISCHILFNPVLKDGSCSSGLFRCLIFMCMINWRPICQAARISSVVLYRYRWLLQQAMFSDQVTTWPASDTHKENMKWENQSDTREGGRHAFPVWLARVALKLAATVSLGWPHSRYLVRGYRFYQCGGLDRTPGCCFLLLGLFKTWPFWRCNLLELLAVKFDVFYTVCHLSIQCFPYRHLSSPKEKKKETILFAKSFKVQVQRISK